MNSGNQYRDQRESFRKVPILRPEQIQKLDQLKRYVNNTEIMNQNRARQSYRPSKGSFRPSRSLKKQSKQFNQGHNQRKMHQYTGGDSSGTTKQFTFNTFDQSDSSKRRLTQKSIVQNQQQGIVQKCCSLFNGQSRSNHQSPFKAARNVNYRR